MIVSTISSGLGNQLFQYAFGRVLSLYHGVPFKTDLYWYQHTQNTAHRAYGLSHFAINAPEATWQELDTYIHADTRLHRLTRPYYKRIRIKEKANRYDPNVWRFPKHTYVQGYWQAWRYYEDYHGVLSDEFQITTPPSEKATRLLEQLNQPGTVSLHIRRGDYTTNPSFNTLPVAYYQRAVTHLQQHHENLSWYVFSDDIPWVREHIPMPKETIYVTGLADIDDFRLMQSATHTVMANSTFSWWAAWLKPRLSGLTTVAPAELFTNPALYNADDLLPPYFTRV
jgi:hypothetical protein